MSVDLLLCSDGQEQNEGRYHMLRNAVMGLRDCHFDTPHGRSCQDQQNLHMMSAARRCTTARLYV